jgi:hypothetical protein
MALTGTMTEVVAAPADAVFAVITDIDRLPEWNAIVHAVVEGPAAMTRDAEWVVELRSFGSNRLGIHCRSNSTVLGTDSGQDRFL